MPKKKLGEPTSTAVIYIGQQRYQLLAKLSREISYLSNTDVKTTTLLHYLIDEFIQEGHASLLNQLQKAPPAEEE